MGYDKTMERLLIEDTIGKIEEEVTIAGFVETIRLHGKIAFLDVRDRTGILQVVVIQSQTPEDFQKVSDMHPQDVVRIDGIIHKRNEKNVNPDLPTGTVELESKTLTILSKSEVLPFDMGTQDLELQLPTLLDWRPLSLRHKKIKGIFKVQEALLAGFRNAASGEGCTEIVVPTISASSTEGGAEVFKVKYYEHDAFLTQSPQLYKQMMVPVFERVYTISHAYRAEPSVTTRHLSEVTQMDCEIGFVDFSSLLDILEKIATKMIQHTETSCEYVLREFGVDKVLYGSIPRLTLSEAQEIIFKETGRDNRGEKDLEPQDEIDICTWAKKNHSSDFVTITHFPLKKRAFYTEPDPQNPDLSLSFDLLFRGVEISSGSMRIHETEKLIEAIKNKGMNPEAFGMYLKAFRFGMPPEGGFSLGLERITMHVLNLGNVREASLFPRDMERVDERFSKEKEEV